MAKLSDPILSAVFVGSGKGLLKDSIEENVGR